MLLGFVLFPGRFCPAFCPVRPSAPLPYPSARGVERMAFFFSRVLLSHEFCFPKGQSQKSGRSPLGRSPILKRWGTASSFRVLIKASRGKMHASRPLTLRLSSGFTLFCGVFHSFLLGRLQFAILSTPRADGLGRGSDGPTAFVGAVGGQPPDAAGGGYYFK